MTSVALVELHSTDDITTNLDRIDASLEAAAEQAADLVVLPEAATYRGPLIAGAIEPAGGPVHQRLAEAARRLGVGVVLGGVWTESGDPARPFNSQVVFDSSGAVVARYDKVHLFSLDHPDAVVDEGAFTTAGDRLLVARLGDLALGLSICYDLRFPAQYAALAAVGADVLLVPANFSARTGPHHWLPLLTARAIENLSFVVAPAQTGRDTTGFEAYGHSVAIDPWGCTVVPDQVLSPAADTSVLVVDLAPERITEARSRLRSPQDARPDVYSGSVLVAEQGLSRV